MPTEIITWILENPTWVFIPIAMFAGCIILYLFGTGVIFHPEQSDIGENNKRATKMFGLFFMFLPVLSILIIIAAILSIDNVNAKTEPPSELGGLNLSGYCTYKFGPEAQLVIPQGESDPYKWQCHRQTDGNQTEPYEGGWGIDFNAACQYTYRDGEAYAVLARLGDVFSWNCYK